MAVRTGRGTGTVIALAAGALSLWLARPGEARADELGRGCVGMACRPPSASALFPRATAFGASGLGVGSGQVFVKTSGAGSTSETLLGAAGFCLVLGAIVALGGLGVALANPASQPASWVVTGVGGALVAAGIGVGAASFAISARNGISRGARGPWLALAPSGQGVGVALALGVAF